MANSPFIPRQFDANRRVTIPNEILDAAGIKPGVWVGVSFDENDQTIKLQLLQFVPRAELNAAKPSQASAAPKADAKQAEQPPKADAKPQEQPPKK